MLRSLSTGVTGLRAHQQALDVIGNNIANVNTIGFKQSRATFADLLSQTIGGEVAPGGTTGGKDIQQIGLGTRLAGIRTIFTQADIQSTEHPTDLAIEGGGLFILANGSERFYTRAGAFTIDADGALVDSVTGYRVQGTVNNVAGDITIAPGATIPGSATSSALFGGNLDASSADGTAYPATFSVYDSLGNQHALTLTFTKNFAAAAGRWDWAVTESDAQIASLTGATGNVLFNTSGAVASGATGALGLAYAATAGVATPQAVTLDFGSATNTSPVTGYAGNSTAALTGQNGFSAGALQTFTIGTDGLITGHYDNGRNAAVGQLQLATFANPAGLIREGNNLFRTSQNSGVATVGNPGSGGRGSLLAGALENSNVDLAREFTELITAQRGFEANTRIIRTGDELLQSVMNIKQ
jgi:flagellar hook protein FlgE